jgi:hypothetical protein
MAIKVSNTTVINDSRALQNIASVDSTTAASITAAGVGGGPELYTVPTWGSPQTTYTSSTTWNKPGSVGDNDWVTFYLVGGGGSGYNWGANFSQGGHGAAAYIVCILGSEITSGVTITVGAGGAGAAVSSQGNAGGDTSISMGGNSFTADGGLAGSGQQSSSFDALGGFRLAEQSGFPNAIPLSTDVNGGSSRYSSGGTSNGSVFGGAGGGGWYYGQAFPATSTYGGNGGAYTAVGSVPGGGGGGGLASGSYAGGSGSVRIYY